MKQPIKKRKTLAFNMVTVVISMIVIFPNMELYYIMKLNTYEKRQNDQEMSRVCESGGGSKCRMNNISIK